MTIKQITTPANLYAVEWDHGYYTSESNEYKILKSLGIVELSEEMAQEIEFNPINQSNSQAWSKARSVRLTASLFHSCCLQLETEGVTSLVNRILNSVKFKSKATNHGIIYEEKAVKKFNQLHHNKLDIKTCGLFVPTERPYLGATPDHLLAQHSIIEVKCPYSIRRCKINEETLSYIEKDCDGNLVLKQNHPYYYQIQGQLYVTSRKFCDFLVDTFNDFIRISIERDDSLIENMLQKLDLFYESHLKPVIIEKYLFKNYKAVF